MAKSETKISAPDARAEAGQDIDAEIRALRADVAALAQSLKAYAGATAEDVRARGRAATDDAAEEALKAVRELRQEVEGLQGRLEGEVRANPLAWLAGAAGLGLLLGLLFQRRA